MAEANVRKLLRLYKLRDKYDAVILAVHACFTEKGFSCVGSGEQVCIRQFLENTTARDKFCASAFAFILIL